MRIENLMHQNIQDFSPKSACGITSDQYADIIDDMQLCLATSKRDLS